MPLDCREPDTKIEKAAAAAVFSLQNRGSPTAQPQPPRKQGEAHTHTQAGLIFSSYRYFDSKQSSDVRVRPIEFQDELENEKSILEKTVTSVGHWPVVAGMQWTDDSGQFADMPIIFVRYIPVVRKFLRYRSSTRIAL